MKVQWLVVALALGGLAPAQTQAVNEQAVVRMARQVQREVLMLPEYGVFDSIRFSVVGDKIVLRGQASRPLLKSSAENVVKRVEGVAKVENHPPCQHS